ncbi:MAG: hypothetical protein ACREAK_04065 [Nitrosarchaeum sp.]
MNLYDMIQIHCGSCRKWIGEIAYDSKIMEPRCVACDNPNEVSFLTTSLNTTALILYKKESGMD